MAPAAGWPINIGVEGDAVAHAHRNVIVDEDVVPRRHVRREAHRLPILDSRLEPRLNQQQPHGQRQRRIAATANTRLMAVQAFASST